MSETQLAYLIKLEVLKADVGGQRKRFSPFETRMAIVAAALQDNGANPHSIKEPIEWLRDAATYPESVEIPDDVVRAKVAIVTERFRHVFKKEHGEMRDFCVEWLAYTLLASERSTDIFLSDRMDVKEATIAHIAEYMGNDKELSEVKASDIFAPFKQRAAELLTVPPSWTLDEVNSAELAVQFEASAIGKAPLFFQCAASEDNWATRMNKDIAGMDGFTHWTTVDLTGLFKQRPILG
ncbi:MULTISPECIES: hypothetical protein [unclassified Marinovum]|uniref:hypothetical protein n=1 Tax=unclassified Marinovum TaxID=2647166 RepID=UPI003EDB7782